MTKTIAAMVFMCLLGGMFLFALDRYDQRQYALKTSSTVNPVVAERANWVWRCIREGNFETTSNIPAEDKCTNTGFELYPK